MNDETTKGWMPTWLAWTILVTAVILGACLTDVLIKAVQ